MNGLKEWHCEITQHTITPSVIFLRICIFFLCHNEQLEDLQDMWMKLIKTLEKKRCERQMRWSCLE